jgi:hypothetical protein
MTDFQPANGADRVIVKVVSSTFFRPVSVFAFGSGAFSGPSSSGSIDCRSA